MNHALLAIVLLAAAVTPIRPAIAHEVRPAYLEIGEVAPDRFEVLWKQPSRGELMLRLEPKLSNGLLDRQPDELYSAESFVIRRWKNVPLARESFDGATLRIDGLERSLTDALISIRFTSGQQIQRLLKPAQPVFTIELTGAGKRAVPAYLVLGIEHILTGFDHLAFVLGLILLVRGRWLLVKTISAFTLAHSITLAAAAMGYVRLNVPVIESLVALSIVFVAVELTRSGRGHHSLTTLYPWVIALTFGLLHGFAFAGSLADIGLPERNIAAALFLFNCGVEIGQLMFVAVVLAVMALWRSRWQTKMTNQVRWAAAYGIGALSCYWLFERIAAFVQ